MSRALLQIHFCVFLWGFTAILGRLISLPATQIVAWRMLLVVALLAFLPRVWRALRGLDARALLTCSGIGVLVAAHWLAFYGSVKLANASVAAVALGVAPAVTAVIEPWITRAAFRARDLALGLIVVPGMWLIFGGVPASMHAGLWVGVLSAVLAALFIALNKRHAAMHDALAVTAVEIAAGGALVLAILPWLTAWEMSDAGAGNAYRGWLATPQRADMIWLLVLAGACTIVPFALSLVALRELSAFTAQLAVNLEPLYTIAIAAIWLGEARDLDAPFYIGTGILLLGVVGHGWWKIRSHGATD